MAEHRRLSDETVAGTGDTDEHGDGKVEHTEHGIREVRASDIEPYTGLRYLSKLFRFMAIILLLLLVAEVATGVYTQGSAAIPTLLGEASRLVVLAGVLWGTGDLAHLLIDVGHDVRAGRILIARIAHAANIPPLIPSRSGGGERLVAERTVVKREADVTPAVDRKVADRGRQIEHQDEGTKGPPIP